jgi:para-nitrobenzyl esterase
VSPGQQRLSWLWAVFALTVVARVSLAAVPPTVQTTEGPVRGEANGQAAIFRGIPFAAPPVGSLRWRAPQPPAARGSTLDASSFAPPCPQWADTTLVGSEDCLYLNVWAPFQPVGQRWPVMLFIHGGGNTGGSAGQMTHNVLDYDGLSLEGLGVVVVTIDYRLGPLGFLAHPALTAEDEHHSSGNYAVLDQLAAVSWVKANIANFGGDPGNITVFGQSAGGRDTFNLLVTPLAAGLFSHAIVESGGGYVTEKPLHDLPGSSSESAEALGSDLAAAVGCTGVADPADCLRSKSVLQVFSAVLPDGTPLSDVRWGPAIDGHVFPTCILDLVGQGMAMRVPVILGTNADDGTVATSGGSVDTPAEAAAAIRGLIPGISDAQIAQIFAAYPASAYGSVEDAFQAFATDYGFLCPTRSFRGQLAPRQPTWGYEFTHVLASSPGSGAFHGEELRFVFGNLDAMQGGVSQAERTLSQEMQGYWVNFARAGDPNGATLPPWPAQTAQSDTVLVFDTPIALGAPSHSAGCALLGAVVPPSRAACQAHPVRRHLKRQS